MFGGGENGERSRSLGWFGILAIVAVLIAVIQMIRTNPPAAVGSDEASPAVIWTRGEIIDGPAEIPANRFLSFALNLNHRSTLDGQFSTGTVERRVTCLIINASDLERWKNGEEVKKMTNTGLVPSGTIKRVLEAGRYLLIFDNRANPERVPLPNVRFSVD